MRVFINYAQSDLNVVEQIANRVLLFGQRIEEGAQFLAVHLFEVLDLAFSYDRHGLIVRQFHAKPREGRNYFAQIRLPASKPPNHTLGRELRARAIGYQAGPQSNGITVIAAAVLITRPISPSINA